MSVTVLLLAYALTLSMIAARLLRGAKWTDRAPRLAIVSWQALTVAIVSSVAMAGTALIIPTMMVSPDLLSLVKACLVALREQFATPMGAVNGSVGIALSVATIGRSALCLCTAIARTARERAQHRRVLDLVGRRDNHTGIVVLDSEQSAVYCLPGLRRRVVVTTAALNCLSAAQFEAVLVHERAHLKERHDWIVTCSAALAKAFVGVAVFQWAARETARLVELRADDVAAAHTDRLTLAAALLAVVTHQGGRPAPGGGLALGGSDAGARVRRLIPPRNPLGPLRVLAGLVAVVAVLTIPVLLIGASTPDIVHERFCASILGSATSS